MVSGPAASSRSTSDQRHGGRRPERSGSGGGLPRSSHEALPRRCKAGAERLGPGPELVQGRGIGRAVAVVHLLEDGEGGAQALAKGRIVEGMSVLAGRLPRGHVDQSRALEREQLVQEEPDHGSGQVAGRAAAAWPRPTDRAPPATSPRPAPPSWRPRPRTPSARPRAQRGVREAARAARARTRKMAPETRNRSVGRMLPEVLASDGFRRPLACEIAGRSSRGWRRPSSPARPTTTTGREAPA